MQTYPDGTAGHLFLSSLDFLFLFLDRCDRPITDDAVVAKRAANVEVVHFIYFLAGEEKKWEKWMTKS